MTDSLPADTSEYKNRGDDLAKRGDFEGAIGQYQKAIELDPGNIPAWNNLSVAYRRLGRLEEAERAQTRRRELEENRTADDLKKKGDERAKTGDYGGAVGYYRNAVEVNPASIPAWNNLSVAYSRLGKKDEAAAAWKRKIELEAPPDKTPAPERNPSPAGQEHGDLGAAGAQPGDTSWSDKLLGRLGSVREVLPDTKIPKQGIDVDSVPVDSPVTNEGEGPASKDTKVAATDTAGQMRSPPLAPEEGPPGEPDKKVVQDYPTVADLKGKGDEYAEHGEFVVAIGYYQKAIALDPYNIPAWTNLGVAYRQIGRLEESEECRLRGRELAALKGSVIEEIEGPPIPGIAATAEPPARPVMPGDRGQETAKETPAAVSPKITEPRKRPEDFDSSTDLKKEGDRLAKAGEFESAIGFYQKAIELDPSSTKAWNNLGYTYHRLGMDEEAARCRSRRNEFAALIGEKQSPGGEQRPFIFADEIPQVKKETVSFSDRIRNAVSGFHPLPKKGLEEFPQPPTGAPVEEPSHLQAPVMQKGADLTISDRKTKADRKTKQEDPRDHREQPDYMTGTAVERRSKLLPRLNPFSKTGKKTGRMLEAYNPTVNGNLVDEFIPPGYDPVDEYWIDEGRAHIRVMRNTLTNQNEYLLFEPSLSEFEYELLERLYEDLRDVLILKEEDLISDRKKVLFGSVQDLLDEYGIALSDTTIFKLQYFIQRNFLGWLRIDALMRDPHIEDISCDGIGVPIFLYHRKYRNIKTNIVFEEADLNSLAITLAQRSGKHISIGNPMIGATLPDGSRLQLSLGTEVTTRGTSFTIRKFREVPFTPIELMNFNTFNLESLVYFWIAIENNKSLIFVGGTASGKTTSLNAVSLFIPPLAKIVSIEDTREITLYHENWIATVTRESVAEGMGTTIQMFDLLKAAMRQRPEFIIVGEVRGVEAQTLFQAMNTGHTTFSTMHAGSVDAAIHRLESEPLNVPRNMIQALNIVSVQALIHREGERVRRCLEIVELAGIDPVTGNIQVNTVFEYNPVEDLTHFSGRSLIYNDITAFHGWNSQDFAKEVETRRRVLAAMREQDLTDYTLVSSIIQAFATDRDLVMRNLGNLRAVIR